MKNEFIKVLKRDKNIYISIFLSFLATTGLIKAMEINSGEFNLTNSFLGIIIFFLYIEIYNKKIKEFKLYQKREKIFYSIFSLYISISVIVGLQLEFYSEILWTILTLAKIFLLTFSILPIVFNIVDFVKKLKPNNKIKIDSKKNSIITFIIILLLNFLVFLAIYPGVYGYDAGFQIMEILESDIAITSHFSILHSYILAFLVNLGKTLFNSYDIGFAFYSLFQMTFLTYVTTKITITSFKLSKNIYLYLLSLLFFSFFPLYTVMVLSSTQDVFFAGFFALIIINLFELINNDKYFEKKSNPIKLFILIFLFCLFKNNGYYSLLVALPFIIIFNKNKRIFITIIFIFALISYKIYSGPFLDYLNVVKGNAIREMLSIPSQQIARVYNYNFNIFTNEEIKELNNYYTNLEEFKHYTYRQSISDPTKSVLNTEIVEENFTDYLKFYINIGLKDPTNYIEAFGLNTLGIWYPNKDYVDYRMYHPYLEFEMLDAKFWNERYVEINRNSKFKLYEIVLDYSVSKNAWKKIPVISSFFTIGTYFITYMFILLYSILNKKYKLLVPFSLILGLLITVLLAPVALFRYNFPIIIIWPILISTFYLYKEKN